MAYIEKSFKRPRLIFCLLLWMTLPSCDLFSDPQRTKVSIQPDSTFLEDAAFSPNPILVHFGGTVVWKNNDKVIHSIVGDAKSGICAFKSDEINQGRTFKKTFLKRTTCNYYCGVHGKTMRGKIIVR